VVVFAASRRIRKGDEAIHSTSLSRQAGREDGLPGWVNVRHLDLDDVTTYAPALEGIDRLFLLAGYTVAMLEQGKNLIDAGVAAGASHIVHLGTFHPRGGASSRLVRHFVWHQLVEAYIEYSGVRFTHLHPSTFMQNFIGALSGDTLRMFFADQRIGLVDCKDVAYVGAAALLDPAKHGGKRYYPAPEALTMDEAATVLSEELRRPIQYQRISPSELRNSPLAHQIEPAYFECIVDIAERMQRRELPDFAQKTNDVEVVTGRPATSFREFVRREIDAFTM
jgi:NAD(P)H dehydrogenase (quinone)